MFDENNILNLLNITDVEAISRWATRHDNKMNKNPKKWNLIKKFQKWNLIKNPKIVLFCQTGQLVPFFWDVTLNRLEWSFQPPVAVELDYKLKFNSIFFITIFFADTIKPVIYPKFVPFVDKQLLLRGNLMLWTLKTQKSVGRRS